MAMVSFGSERKRGATIAIAAGLIAISIAIVVAWRSTGGRINGSVLIPAVVGITLLLRRSGGTIEYEDGRDELVVTRRSMLQRKVTRLKKRDLRGLTIASAKNVHQLRLELAEGEHFVLLETPNERALRAEEKVVSDFALEHKLL